VVTSSRGPFSCENAGVAQAVTLVWRQGNTQGLGDVVSIGDFTVARIVQQPGLDWR
jgi:hypothetical protein